MGMMSQNKGKRGELEVVKLFEAAGWKSRRGQQHRGGPDSPDVVIEDCPLHVEVKRMERFDLYGALRQAERDAPVGLIPTVFHRRNEEPWVVVLSAEDFFTLLRRR